MSHIHKVTDLRSALALLSQYENELIETDEPVDPSTELSGVYRYIGAHGTVMRPTRVGPAMLFNTIKGYTDMRVLIGLLASRKLVARLLHSTPEDAGPYFTLGMCYAADPQTGEHDVTIHRLCVQGRDEISMYFVPGRHLDTFRQKAENAGLPLPISISIGVDPAIEIGGCFEPPTTPIGYDELSVAGSLRQQPVELVDCLTVKARAIASAEVVIEGELLPDYRVREDQHTNSGKATPEFPGYTGKAQPRVPVIKVKAITHRRHPILQTCIGPSDEHTNMAGIPTEASILQLVERALPGFVLNVHCPSPGTGKYLAVIQVKKSQASDEGRQRQAALLAFSAFSELKHVMLVDEDVDIFDLSDVIWAMTTRYQGDVSTVFIPGVRCHPLDPSSDPAFSYSVRDHGIACKTIFDCTVPFSMKDAFRRSAFMDVDIRRFLPDGERG